MLAMRPNCERCDRDLPAEQSNAVVCSFECTFCKDCDKKSLKGKCPNCGGNLVERPTRTGEALENFPASTNRVYKGA